MSADLRRIVRLSLAVLAVVLVLGLWWWASGPTTDQSSASPRSTVAASGRDSSGLPSVQATDLPQEARRTLELIASGGPYPYARDGVVFQNRERLLPRKAGGYYHEFTVTTPGENDRGARRIITGTSGERYWTDDHYASFRVIEDGAR